MLILHDSKSTVRLAWFTQPIKASCVHWLSQVVAAIIYSVWMLATANLSVWILWLLAIVLACIRAA